MIRLSFCGGLKCGKDHGGLGYFVLRGGLRRAVLVGRFFGHSEELGDDSGAIFFDFDFGREGAVDGIEGDLFYGFGFDRPAAAGQSFGQV